MHEPVTIEMTQSPDVALLAELHAACFEQGWDAQMFRDLIASGMTAAFLALAGESIAVGFALVRHVAGEAEILTLGVLPAWRKRNIAAALVSGLCRWGLEHKLESIFLEVREANIAALALYRKAGFHQIALRKDYYHNADGSCEHAVVMRYSA